MAACAAETRYQIFLDLRKAYNSIDRGRVLKILEKYKVGPKIRRYISSVWENQRFLLRQQGVYSVPLDVERGCTQGDTDSPIIFNIIVDAVLRAWKIGTFKNTKALFYADDGLLEHTNAEELQQHLNKIIGLFERVGLRTNETKTKYMIF